MPSTSPQTYHPVTHVIFDCDGLLVNSEKYYSEAISEVAERHGKIFDYQIKVDMMGKCSSLVYSRQTICNNTGSY
jgi:pseudouridine-5'-monophosphatase